MVCEGSELNLNGIAPTTRMLVDRAKQLGVALPPSVSNAPHGFNRPSAAERKWALLFRRRWDAALGKIKPVEPLTPSEMIEKVCHSDYAYTCYGNFVLVKQNWTRICDRILVANFASDTSTYRNP